MACRKQHFIQRFLLKGFSFGTSGDSSRIWVYPRNGNIFESALEKYGAERDFYGHPDQSELDSNVTELENNRFNDFLDGMRRRPDQELDVNDAAEFAIHVFFRSKNLRSVLTAGMEKLLPQTLGKLRDPIILERFIASGFRRDFLAANPQANVPEDLIKIYAQYAVAASATHFESLFKGLEQRVANIVADAHRKSLSERLTDFRGSRVELFKSLQWAVLKTEKRLVLGDSVAFSELEDGLFKPVTEPQDSVLRVWIPISTNQILVGSRNNKAPILDVEHINRASASCSFDAFCAFDGPREHESMISQIRMATFTLDQAEAERIANECIMEAIK
jgi:hypothetical protein